jgi:hypothetical protein
VDALARLEVYNQAELEALKAALVKYNLYPPVEWVD